MKKIKYLVLFFYISVCIFASSLSAIEEEDELYPTIGEYPVIEKEAEPKQAEEGEPVSTEEENE